MNDTRRSPGRKHSDSLTLVRPASFKRLLDSGRTGAEILKVITNELRLRIAKGLEAKTVILLITATERRMLVRFAECLQRSVFPITLEHHPFGFVCHDGLLDYCY